MTDMPFLPTEGWLSPNPSEEDRILCSRLLHVVQSNSFQAMPSFELVHFVKQQPGPLLLHFKYNGQGKMAWYLADVRTTTCQCTMISNLLKQRTSLWLLSNFIRNTRDMSLLITPDIWCTSPMTWDYMRRSTPRPWCGLLRLGHSDLTICPEPPLGNLAQKHLHFCPQDACNSSTVSFPIICSALRTETWKPDVVVHTYK